MCSPLMILSLLLTSILSPGGIAEDSADERVYQLLHGYHRVEITRDLQQPGRPIVEINLGRLFYPTAEDLRRIEAEAVPLEKAVAQAIPLFAKLRSLRTLSPSLYPWKDEHMKYLRNHPSLEHLDLTHSRQVTWQGLEQLRGLKLKTLTLPRRFQTQRGLAVMVNNLQKPATLSLSSWDLTDASLQNLTQLSSLKTLALPTKGITDQAFQHLTALTKLESLSVSGQQIDGSGLALLKKLPRLRELHLHGDQLTEENLLQLRNLKGLERLWLAAPQLSDDGLGWLAGMPNLREFHLTAPEIRGAGLRLLSATKLERATVRCPELTDEGLEHLSRCSHLKSLALASPHFSGEGLAKLIPLNLTKFDLSTALLRSEGAVRSYLLLQKNRTWFIFRGAPVTDETLQTLQQIPKIEVFGALHAQITDKGLKVLAKRQEIKTIDLTGCPVTDAGMRELAKLPRLEELVIRGTQVTDAGLEHLLSIPTLDRLFVDNRLISRKACQAFEKKHGYCDILITRVRRSAAN